jgi:hypothetical protein
MSVSCLPSLVPASAMGAFTRPFLNPISGTASGAFDGPSGLAIDSTEDLWVSEVESRIPSFSLDEFEPSGAFIKTVKVEGITPPQPEGPTPPASIAIGQADTFYTTGPASFNGFTGVSTEIFSQNGTFINRFGIFGGPAHVAVDNSTNPADPDACSPFGCTVYVSHGKENPEPKFKGNSQISGVEKFRVSATGESEPISFEETAKGATYIKGNEIIGSPRGNFKSVAPTPGIVTVDSSGNIYVVSNLEHERQEEPEAVYEYEPSGKFIREFTGTETGGLGESHGYGGFGGEIEGLAVDPLSGHVVLSVDDPFSGEAAIDEFESSGTFVNQITESPAGVRLRSASELAISSHGKLYVVDSSADAVDVFGPGAFLPSLKLKEADKRTQTTAFLAGSVDPEGQSLSECTFEYVSEAAFDVTGFSDLSTGGRMPCRPTAAEISKEKDLNSVYPVSSAITGLLSGTTYRYRLVAATSGLLGGDAATAPLAFTAPHAPSITAASATNISSTFADLNAQIAPLGAATSYHFEYDTVPYNGEATHGLSVPDPNAEIGEGGPTGSQDASVVQQIKALVPSTTYYYRVVAENEAEGGAVQVRYGQGESFRTLSSSTEGRLGDRAYELVTPPNKGSAEDMFAAIETERNNFFNLDVGYPSESGNGFLLYTTAAFGSFAASGSNAYVFSRTDDGWQTKPLASPSLGVQSIDGFVFEPFEFSDVGINDGVGSLVSSEGLRRESLVGPPEGPYATVNVDAFVHHDSEPDAAETEIVGASHDINRIFLTSKNHRLASGAEKQDVGSEAIYEDMGGECNSEPGNCGLVNVDSSGLLLSRCGAVLGEGSLPGTAHNAVSADGSRAIFTTPDPEEKYQGVGCWNGGTVDPPEVYMRSHGKTIELSAPEKGVTEEGHAPVLHSAVYVGASEDDDKIFFTSETELTKDAAEQKLHDLELYECEIVEENEELKCKLTRISSGDSGSPARMPGSPGAQVNTVPAVAEQGSAVFFTAYGRLVSTAPAVAPGEVNLYRYDTNTGITNYVATVSERDYPNSSGSGIALNPKANWYTTPDGRYLLFASIGELAGYSTVEAAPGDCPNIERTEPQSGHCAEIYRYDSDAGSLTCVSCESSGALPTSNASFAQAAAGAPDPAGGPVQAISNDGSYAFFDTADPLVPQDSNGTQDVYQWHEGDVSLISSGQDPAPSYFLGQSATNIKGTLVETANVFFGTHAKLVSQDTDTAGDLYDARIDGGFPPPAAETGACEGDACQSPSTSPIDATPVSLTFAGPPNVIVAASKADKTKSISRSQELKNALKKCASKPKRKRSSCDKSARKRYGNIVKNRKSSVTNETRQGRGRLRSTK